jgi:hypothetical protein
MFLKMKPVPFGRNPRILIKTWCEHINSAACGLAIPTGDQKQRAKLDKLIKLELLDALNLVASSWAVLAQKVHLRSEN